VSPSQPTWRRVFDRVERTVGKPLEEAVASSRYVDVMLTTMKVQRAVGGAVGRAVDHRIGGLLHAINIPTRSDVRRLSRQLTSLTSEVRALAATTQELRTLAEAEAEPAVAPAEDATEVRHSA
jgi:hypothetical protein